eukprot:1154898-Rhodomonas_salina.5
MHRTDQACSDVRRKRGGSVMGRRVHEPARRRGGRHVSHGKLSKKVSRFWVLSAYEPATKLPVLTRVLVLPGAVSAYKHKKVVLCDAVSCCSCDVRY